MNDNDCICDLVLGVTEVINWPPRSGHM